MTIKTLALAATIIALPVLAYAQMDHSNHGAPKADAAAPSTKAYGDANAKMHMDMDIKFSGNADVDFIRGMIPHHQGAIDMAKVELAHGKDPVARKMAEKVIADQEREIGEMKEWLAKSAK